MMKKILSIMLVMVLCFTLTTNTASASIKISKTKATMEVDSTLKLKISGSTSKTKWTSSKNTVATVNSSGAVTAKKEGQATITATVNSNIYTCEINVVDSNKNTEVASSKSYTESKYKAGQDIPEGEYVIFVNKNVSRGYFSVSTDSNEKNIITNDNFEYNTIVYIKDGEYLKLSRSYAVPITDVAALNTDGTGMFKIGVHLPAGEYKLIADVDSSGYYCIYNDNRQDDIECNDNFKGNTYVTVKEGQYLLLSRCKIVN